MDKQHQTSNQKGALEPAYISQSKRSKTGSKDSLLGKRVVSQIIPYGTENKGRD